MDELRQVRVVLQMTIFVLRLVPMYAC